MVATPPQLKRASNDNDHISFGLITNGKPIKRGNNSIAKPRSRRSSLASSDSPRLVTTPGRRNSLTPRSRRNSLAAPDNKMDRRRLSLSLVLEKAYDEKENSGVFALISPQINKNEISHLKSSLMTSDFCEINNTCPSISRSPNRDNNGVKRLSPTLNSCAVQSIPINECISLVERYREAGFFVMKAKKGRKTHPFD